MRDTSPQAREQSRQTFHHFGGSRKPTRTSEVIAIADHRHDLRNRFRPAMAAEPQEKRRCMDSVSWFRSSRDVTRRLQYRNDSSARLRLTFGMQLARFRRHKLRVQSLEPLHHGCGRVPKLPTIIGNALHRNVLPSERRFQAECRRNRDSGSSPLARPTSPWGNACPGTRWTRL